jgi:hypothetical protein
MDKECRKAMVELLLLAPYLDQHLSLLEDEALERALTAIGWSPSRPDDVCLTTAFATVREACSEGRDTQSFMRERAAVIRSAGQSALALEWLGRILGSDGLSERESHFLQQARSQLSD